ncbi:hypothetical protein quinque_016352 [Culex quinquefasciatus]
MVAVAKAVLCGVLMVCNYVTRDQQTAAVDSYIAVMQGGLGSLQQNVARAQGIQSNVNYVWQQQMNNALDQYYAAYTTDATTILNTLDAWIKLIRSTFMTKTANYQLTRDLLMTSFNSSIAAGPGMMRSCAQHYYAQFEGIEYNLLLNIGKAYSTGAGTLATQAAGFTHLHNMNEADEMRQLMAFSPDMTLLQDAIDNWNTVYNRIALRSSTMINDLRTAVQTMMTTVDAAIVVPATMTTTLNQVRSAYALCTRVG